MGTRGYRSGVSRPAPPLDVILSDYEMPEFSGLRALEVLHERGLEIPFIIISGSTAVAAMKLGAADYLLKDRLTRLGPAVSQAMEQARLPKERKQVEEELRATYAQLQYLLDHSPAVTRLAIQAVASLPPRQVRYGVFRLCLVAGRSRQAGCRA
jgi:DNA-binding NtrC family response regulator